jgi:hypothetical protein
MLASRIVMIRWDSARAEAISAGCRRLKSSSSSLLRWCRSRSNDVICCSAGLIAAGETPEHMMSSSQSIPLIFFCMVVKGIISVSSWSCPVGDCPFGLSMPMTRTGKF